MPCVLFSPPYLITSFLPWLFSLFSSTFIVSLSPFFCPLSPVCRLTVLQSSSKPVPSSSLSSLSRRLQPLKVVNRKRPPRDDWNNYSRQGDHEADGASLGVDEDTCIKVRRLFLCFVLAIFLFFFNVVSEISFYLYSYDKAVMHLCDLLQIPRNLENGQIP